MTPFEYCSDSIVPDHYGVVDDQYLCTQCDDDLYFNIQNQECSNTCSDVIPDCVSCKFNGTDPICHTCGPHSTL